MLKPKVVRVVCGIVFELISTTSVGAWPTARHTLVELAFATFVSGTTCGATSTRRFCHSDGCGFAGVPAKQFDDGINGCPFPMWRVRLYH